VTRRDATPQPEGCFTCRKGTATFFWKDGRMEVRCQEFGIVVERDSCDKHEPLRFMRQKEKTSS